MQTPVIDANVAKMIGAMNEADYNGRFFVKNLRPLLDQVENEQVRTELIARLEAMETIYLDLCDHTDDLELKVSEQREILDACDAVMAKQRKEIAQLKKRLGLD